MAVRTQEPLVSVVVPFLDAQPFLEAAVQSVLDQTYPHWELLLVDDGSTDASSDLARTMARRHPDRIRYLEHASHRNEGVCASRNLGVREARGEYVALLDADDVWLEDKLAEQVGILQSHPAVAMVYGRSMYWRSWDPAAEKGDFTIELGVAANAVYAPPSLLLLCYPLGRAPTPCPSDLLVRTGVVRAVGGFEESFRGPYQLYEDQAFLAKIFLGYPVYVSDARWDRYRLHDRQCVSVVTGAGQYDTVRAYYFAWLAAYLDREGQGDRRLKRALRKARWPYEHPRLHALMKRLRGAGPSGAS